MYCKQPDKDGAIKTQQLSPQRVLNQLPSYVQICLRYWVQVHFWLEYPVLDDKRRVRKRSSSWIFDDVDPAERRTQCIWRYHPPANVPKTVIFKGKFNPVLVTYLLPNTVLAKP